MNPITTEERHWFLRNVALGLVRFLGVAEPPIPVEELLRQPPDHFKNDFGVVDMYSTLWDGTFARPLTQRGNVFVRADLPPDERRFVLARELLSALITSEHGRRIGLTEMFISDLRDCAEYFARVLLAPDHLVEAYRSRGGDSRSFAQDFQLPSRIAAVRWEDAISPSS